MVALNRIPFLSACAGLLLLASCSTHDAFNQLSFPQAHVVNVVPGDGFLHRVVLKEGEGENLHVYIEGDGRPWITPISRALDPTPKRPLMLELMALDNAPALYLGRPCYFSTADPQCSDARWWTSHRYSAAIVSSLSAALDKYASDHSAVTLMGYSGGGTLAYLLAAERNDIDTVVTLAANLNVALWSRQHGYTPLAGSLDPARSPPLPRGIRQVHLWGDRDKNVSREVVSSVLEGQENAAMSVLPGADHSCCWMQEWPMLLNRLE